MYVLKTIVTAVIFILPATSVLLGQTQADRIDSLMKTAHQRGFFNGNILVAKKGQVIYQNEFGYADGGKTTTLNPNLRFNIGSISKKFDAVGIMILAEEGKLQLSDPVSRFIGDLPDWSAKVTVKNLLQYTSGLPAVKFDRNKPYTNEDAWRFLQALEKLEFKPGAGFIYSNYNIFLRKRIIEKVSGQSYDTFLRKKIFEPYDMKGAVVNPAPGSPGLARAFDNRFVEDHYPGVMYGGLYLTVGDLYQWTRHLHAYDIISKGSLLALCKGYKSQESSLGLGVVKNNKMMMHWHHGSSYNFESSLYVNPPDGFTVILLTNNKNFNVGDLTNAIDAILKNEPFAIPRKSLYMALRTEIYYNGFESGKKLLNDILHNKKELYDTNEEKAFRKTGGYLLAVGKVEDAMKLLEYATTEYPASADLFTLLGDSYLKQGNNDLALANYEKARDLNPANAAIRAKVKKIKAQK